MAFMDLINEGRRARMRTRGIVDELLPIADAPNRTFLTVYLNVDQSKAENLNRHFLTPLTDAFRKLKQEIGLAKPREELDRNIAVVEAFLEEYDPDLRTLLLVSDADNQVFKHFSLAVDIPTQAYWLPRPYVRPLVSARDEYENRLVALVDRARARILAIRFNEVLDEAGIEAGEDVHRFDASGKDTMWSQMKYQRKADEHAYHHYKNVVAELETRMATGRYDGLVLGGQDEAITATEELLSNTLKARYAGRCRVPIQAPTAKVLEESHRTAKRFERNAELQLVDNLVTRQAKDGAATAGLPDTVRAALDGRIHRLVLADDYCPDEQAFQEAKAVLGERMRAGEGEAASLWPPLERMEGPVFLVEALVEAVLKGRGDIEVVRGEAADRLIRAAHGVGALLRY